MSTNLQQLTAIIDFLKKQTPVTSTISENQISSLIDELKIERSNFLKTNLPALKDAVKRNYKKLRVSPFTLMEYDFHENSHSNILAYLLDYDTFEKGDKILSELIKCTSEAEKEELSSKIFKRTYTLSREFSIPNGRLDILIKDEEEKFIIIIENKLLAAIGSKFIGKAGETENLDEDRVSITQLQIYEEWCNATYPAYSKFFILLNLATETEISTAFNNVSYTQLFNVLKNCKTEDNILEDYVLLLDSILNPKAYSLSDLKKFATTLVSQDEPTISLIEYYTLKDFFYAAKEIH